MGKPKYTSTLYTQAISVPKKMAPIVAAGDSNSVNTKAKFGNAQYAASPIMNGASNSQLAASVLGQSANQTSLFKLTFRA